MAAREVTTVTSNSTATRAAAEKLCGGYNIVLLADSL